MRLICYFVDRFPTHVLCLFAVLQSCVLDIVHKFLKFIIFIVSFIFCGGEYINFSWVSSQTASQYVVLTAKSALRRFMLQPYFAQRPGRRLVLERQRT